MYFLSLTLKSSDGNQKQVKIRLGLSAPFRFYRHQELGLLHMNLRTGRNGSAALFSCLQLKIRKEKISNQLQAYKMLRNKGGNSEELQQNTEIPQYIINKGVSIV